MPLARRYLDLSDNALSGPVPGALAALPSLQYLGLGGNRLSGDLAAFADALPPLSPLLGLNMSGNSITGARQARLGLVFTSGTLTKAVQWLQPSLG